MAPVGQGPHSSSPENILPRSWQYWQRTPWLLLYFCLFSVTTLPEGGDYLTQTEEAPGQTPAGTTSLTSSPSSPNFTFVSARSPFQRSHLTAGYCRLLNPSLCTLFPSFLWNSYNKLLLSETCPLWNTNFIPQILETRIWNPVKVLHDCVWSVIGTLMSEPSPCKSPKKNSAALKDTVVFPQQLSTLAQIM